MTNAIAERNPRHRFLNERKIAQSLNDLEKERKVSEYPGITSQVSEPT
jgi:hypothetical protein